MPAKNPAIPPESTGRLAFDRATGAVAGADARERLLVRTFQAGGRISSSWTHRGFGFGCRMLRPLVTDRDMHVILNDDAVFAFPFGDEYWSTILDRNYVYERDIDIFLRAASDTDYTLLDCGANFGYWSVLVTSAPYGARRALAVEPSSASYAILERNAALNNARFRTVKAAVGSSSGIATLSGRKHESMSIADGDPDGEPVTVFSLDDLMTLNGLAGHRLVVKLDVEGVEIAAMSGASAMLATDCVLMCEDHGNDRAHTVSKFIMTETPLDLFCFDPAADRYIALHDLSPLDRIKKASNRGYNVLATASPFWKAKILGAGTPS